MTDLLSIGATGVRAYQGALGTVSENIANAGVSGYSRRSVGLKQVSVVDRGLTSVGLVNGLGVAMTGVSRAADAYRSQAVREAGADLSRTEAGATWLDRVQTALTGNQLGDRLTAFFGAARTLAADPTSAAARSAMLEQGGAVAASYAATAKALGEVASGLDDSAVQATASLDILGAQLAKVNDGLGRATPGTAGAAALEDQRDQLLEQMSAIVDVTVATDEIGRATVRVGGATGPVFVAAGGEAGHIGYARNADGAVSYSMLREGNLSSVSPQGGALAGIADAAQRVADARRAIESSAAAFVAGVNQVQAAGRDLDGNAGAPMFALDAAGATSMTMVLASGDGIAAAGPGGGQRDNANLAGFERLRTSGGFERGYTDLVAGNAAVLNQRQSVAEAQGAIRDGAVAARDAVSGVNLDNEAVDLLRYQQAYAASSRVIQVARDTLQSILDIR